MSNYWRYRLYSAMVRRPKVAHRFQQARPQKGGSVSQHLARERELERRYRA